MRRPRHRRVDGHRPHDRLAPRELDAPRACGVRGDARLADVDRALDGRRRRPRERIAALDGARQQRRHRGHGPARVPAARRAARASSRSTSSASSRSPRPCLPALRAARGRIVNVSSISGRVALPLYGPYAASKFALEALSDSLRRELRGIGVRVILIEPGAIAHADLAQRGVARRRRALAGDAGGRARALRRAVAGHAAGSRSGRPRGRTRRRRVARVIADALRPPPPADALRVGRDARIQAVLARVLPDRVLDALLDYDTWRTRRLLNNP